MRQLYPTLSIGAGETPPSFVSRLARLHGSETAERFCADLGLDVQGIIDGDDRALAALADLTGADIGVLDDNALRKGEDAFIFKGERLLSRSVKRTVLRACPLCLREDAARGGAPSDAAAYGRAIWQIDHVRTCPSHGVALVAISREADDYRPHDFARRLALARIDIDTLASEAIRRVSSPLETYLLRRLDGDKAQSAWLDGLEFSVAAMFTEYVGVVATHGPKAAMKSLSEDDLYAAGGAGFAITSGGEPDVRGFLSRLQADCRRSFGGKEQANACYGRLYQWLNRVADGAFTPVKDLIARHATETMPLGPGDFFFGKPVERRILHSLYTASVEYGVNSQRLRTILAAQGMLPADHASRTENLVLFDAAAAHGMIEAASEKLTLKDVETYLNAGRVHAKILLDHGLIVPAIACVTKGSEYAFTRSDLDAFMARLLVDAVPVKKPGEEMASIPKAAKLANCSSAEIVRLILDRKLDWVGRRTDTPGYMSVLVKRDEIKRLVRGEAPEGLTALQAERELVTSFYVIRALVDEGILPMKRVLNPLTRHSVMLIEREDLERFRAEYVSLNELATDNGVHIRKMFVRLRDNGIDPALDPETFRARFYRRRDVRHFTSAARWASQ